jgi:hypothetical protein
MPKIKGVFKMRRLRRKNAGETRKAGIRAHGTTPAFAVHPEGAKPEQTNGSEGSKE